MSAGSLATHLLLKCWVSIRVLSLQARLLSHFHHPQIFFLIFVYLQILTLLCFFRYVCLPKLLFRAIWVQDPIFILYSVIKSGTRWRTLFVWVKMSDVLFLWDSFYLEFMIATRLEVWLIIVSETHVQEVIAFQFLIRAQLLPLKRLNWEFYYHRPCLHLIDLLEQLALFLSVKMKYGGTLVCYVTF